MRKHLKIHTVLMPGFVLIALLLTACAESVSDATSTPAPAATHPPLDPTYAAMIAEQRSPDVPELPFPDNPDPSQCGIPTEWGEDNQAWLTGRYRGQLVQPTVLLYDSHLRFNITARASHGSEVRVILYQQNPVTDYYLVEIKGAEPPNQGWVPGPFLSFDPVEQLSGLSLTP